MIKKYIGIQVILTAVFYVLIALAASHKEALSFFVGAFFATLNVLYLIFIVNRLFKKKSIATSLVLILLKYSIFGVGLYYLITSQLLEMIWFVVGLSIILPSILGFSYIYAKQLKKEETKIKEREDNGSL